MEMIIYILSMLYIAMILIFIASVVLLGLFLAVASLAVKIISSIMKKFNKEED